ncbi:helix-turn-helix transcriptional regulator [Microvirga sp. 2YAF29]|uniref:helix-turn-helix transcriptional regulator n=1 Tax=Microvirga sp. 2YAF29 TaxID=3233031 RepID=UPI003F960FD5
MLINNTKFAELLELIYQASADANAWESLAVRLGEVFQSTSSLFIHDAHSNSVVVDMSEGFERSFVESYKEHFVAINPLIPGTLDLPSGNVARMFETVSKEVFEQTEYYNDWLLPQGLKFAMGTHLNLGAHMSMFVAFHRGHGSEDYSDEAMNFLARLVPHFERALEISSRFKLQGALQDAQVFGLDQLGVGAIGLDRQCSVYDISPKAEELIKRGLGFSLRFGRLAMDSPSQDLHLKNLVVRAIDERVAYPIAISLKTGERIEGVIVPSHHHFGGAFTKVQALLLIKFKTAGPEQTIDSISKKFRLTQAETQLLKALAEGQTISDYSDIKRLSRNTVRSQLQSLFQKTGVSRQADLVLLAYDPMRKD